MGGGVAFPEGPWRPAVGSVALNTFIADLQGGGRSPPRGHVRGGKRQPRPGAPPPPGSGRGGLPLRDLLQGPPIAGQCPGDTEAEKRTHSASWDQTDSRKAPGRQLESLWWVRLCPPRTRAPVQTLGPCECSLICQQGLCRRNERRRGHIRLGWVLTPCDRGHGPPERGAVCSRGRHWGYSSKPGSSRTASHPQKRARQGTRFS